MNGEDRRTQLLELIQNAKEPCSGAWLAKQLHVSRQVIVTDIALLRAAQIDIISTNRGYVVQAPSYCKRTFKVNHAETLFQNEMNTIVDAGGKILDIAIDHPVYGQIKAPLEIYSRNDILRFTEKMQSGNAVPLCNITSGIHYHTVLAYSEQILDDVEHALTEHGYLVKE